MFHKPPWTIERHEPANLKSGNLDFYQVWLRFHKDFHFLWARQNFLPPSASEAVQKSPRCGETYCRKKTKNKTQSCSEYTPGASGELVKVNIIEARQWGNIWISNEPQTVEKASIQSPWRECASTDGEEASARRGADKWLLHYAEWETLFQRGGGEMG